MSEDIYWTVSVAIWIGKIALYVGLFIGVGGAFFVNWIGGRSLLASRGALWVVGFSLVAAPLSVGMQGLDALGMGLAGLGQQLVWKTGYSTSYGLTAAIATASMAAALVAILSRGVLGKVLSLAALLGVGVALASGGHGGAAYPQWLTRPAVFLHAIGIAFWAGSLIPLVAVLAARGPEAVSVLRRFSVVIPFAVMPLIAAGMVLALVQLGGIDALWGTAYGQVLMVKLIPVIALFLVAALNRFGLTESAERHDPNAITRLRRTIGVEVALVLVIFAVAACWHFTPRPLADAVGV
ncbi:copper resistance D family protein [Kaistia terrae]|uniref:Copper resistance D family protein n=1 Tax=Kaistia terrae TaxID=537017 RepID=A0ABW0Q0N1_9HYPH|nr:copper resistance D family protein [Kaistia terrae]MCX5581656.1 copper resistance D family protein [Kaistia terrae]